MDLECLTSWVKGDKSGYADVAAALA
jgi:hypothetical protein